MKIIDSISDTHGQHHKLDLPGGDLLIHAGDCSPAEGELEDLFEFLDWFKEQNYRYRILVPGNHDPLFELIPEFLKEECSKRQITLLIDSGCDIEGVSIWGSPYLIGTPDWPFSCGIDDELEKHWTLIPISTEILITHSPPYEILDEVGTSHEQVGCPNLYKKILQTRIKLHVFGHVHAGAGYRCLDGRTYVNASVFHQMEDSTLRGYTRILKEGAGYRVLSDGT